MTTEPRTARWKAIVGGVAVAAALGAALALPTGVVMPEPEYLDIDTVALSPGTRTLVCPGAAQLASSPSASDVSYDLELGSGSDVIESQTVLATASAVSGAESSGLVGQEPVPIPPVFTVAADRLPRVALYPPSQGTHVSAGGMTIGEETTGDLRGLVAGVCAPPATSMWFVGGNTEVGSSTQLILTNPGQTAARVTVSAWTGLGQSAGEIITLVEPGASSVVLTETLERTDRIAFHVTTEGGAVAAYLVTTTLDGIVPGGVSYVTPSAVPGVETFVGPLRLEASTSSDWFTDLRVLNPGTEPAHISVSLLGPDGEEPLPGAQGVVVAAGVVARIPIAAEAEADYTLRVQADVPIAAGVSTSARGDHNPDLAGSPVDLSWMPSSHPAQEAVLLAGTGAIFALSNPAPSEIAIQVEEIGSDGAVTSSQWYEVGAGATIDLDIDASAVAVRVRGEIVLASVQYYRNSGGPLIAHVPALGLTGGGQQLAVVVGN